MLKQLETYIGTIAEAEKRFDRNTQKFSELNKLFYEFEELSLDTYQCSQDMTEIRQSILDIDQ